MLETELKFALDDHAASRLLDRLTQLCPTDARPDDRALKSVYFDTKNHRLRKAGVALRLRKDGDQWVQTVKAKASNKTGLQTAEEAECQIRDAKLHLKCIPNKSLRKSVKALVGGRRLHPVCETDIRRTIMIMRGNDGAEVEVALDRGNINAGTQSRPFQELELELKSGGASALFTLAADLLPGCGFDISRLSKSERGYLLATTGEIAPDLAPRKAITPPLKRSMTAKEAAQAILLECAEQILVNLMVVRRLDDVEGPHQLRIGLRRLRSTMDLFHPLLKGPEFDHLKAEAKWLGQMVGKQRDLDVALVDLLAPAHIQDPKSAGLTDLRQIVEGRAQSNRPMLRDILATKRAQLFALDLAAFAETAPWTKTARTKHLNRPMIKHSRSALDDCWAKVVRRAKGISGLDHHHRHELRKALKGLRYQIEFAAPLFDTAEVTKFIKRLQKLQTLFGDLNDVAMLNDLFRAEDRTLPSDPNTQETLQHLLDCQNAAADKHWEQAKALWRKVEASPAFWR